MANATVNKATDVADTVYTFCETHVPGSKKNLLNKTKFLYLILLETVPVHRDDFGRRTTLLWQRIKSTVGLPIDYVFQFIHYLLTWFRMLIVSFLLKIKQTNDAVLNQMQRTPLPQRLLIHTGAILEYIIERIRSYDRAERKQQQQQYPRLAPPKQFVSR